MSKSVILGAPVFVIGIIFCILIPEKINGQFIDQSFTEDFSWIKSKMTQEEIEANLPEGSAFKSFPLFPAQTTENTTSCPCTVTQGAFSATINTLFGFNDFVDNFNECIYDM